MSVSPCLNKIIRKLEIEMYSAFLLFNYFCGNFKTILVITEMKIVDILVLSLI